MKTIKVSSRARSINELLKKARRENVILRSPEGKEFLLAEIDDFNREIELSRRNKALMKYLDARARQSKTVSMEEAKTLLGLSS
jgi:predicted O-methyltransferase YrrM